MYEVEEIVGKKWIRNKLHYRVKWRGYSLQESTWEKEGNLKTVRDLIDAFLLKQDQKPPHNAFLKTEHGALDESAQLKEREVFDSGDIFNDNRDFASAKDSQIGSNKFQSNELRQLKFNFNQAELVEALKQTNQSQKLAKGISKNQNIRKKAKKMGLNKKQPKKLQIHSLEERKSPIASLKGSNDSAQFQKQALNSEQAELNQTPEFGRCSKTRNNDETEPQMLLGQQTTSPQNQPSKKRLSQRKRQQTVPQTCSQPQPTLHNQSAMLHPLFQTREESKSAYTLSSTSNDKNSQAQKQDHKRRNLKIRLLETEEPRSQIRDYLVQSEEGVLKVYSSIELLVAYPLEFIIYLQGRNYRKK